MTRNTLYMLVIFMLQASIAYGMFNFILMGPPGAGKGTFAEMLVKKYDYIQICPGALLRAEAAKGTALGLLIKADVEQAKPIASSVVCAVVKYYVENAIQAKKAFVLDGFPKNDECFDFLITLLKRHNIESRFVHFYARDNICLERMISRLECHNCGATFNQVFKPPQKLGICNFCQHKLVQRKGDDQATALYRLQDFHQNIEPLLMKIKNFCEVREIDTSSLLINYGEKVYESLMT